MSGKSVASALDLIDSFLEKARNEKQAALKQANTDPSEPTSHPVMRADDGTIKAREGSRSAENNADIRKDYGDLGNTGQVDASKATSKTPADGIGTQKMDADETKGNVQTPKSTKDKPDESSSHPSNATFSQKYSEVHNLGAKVLSSLIKDAAEMPENFKKVKKEKKEGEPLVEVEVEANKEASEQEKMAAAQKYQEDAAAGYMTAQYLLENVMSKQAAANEQIEAGVEHIVKWAQDDAELFAQYLAGHAYGLQKAAEGEMIPPEALAAGADGAADGMGAGPEAGGGDEDAILDQLADALAEAGVTPEQLAEALAQEQAEGGSGEADEAAAAAAGAGAGEETAEEGKMASAKNVKKAQLLNVLARQAAK